MHSDLEKAVKILEAGGLVAIPTETVYGLAADAENEAAVKSIYAAKNRPATHPLIVHVASAEALPYWAREIPEDAKKLTEAFWPGPLTIVLKRSAHAKDFVTGGQDTVALRCPSHPLAHELLKRFDAGKVRQPLSMCGMTSGRSPTAKPTSSLTAENAPSALNRRFLTSRAKHRASFAKATSAAK